MGEKENELDPSWNKKTAATVLIEMGAPERKRP